MPYLGTTRGPLIPQPCISIPEEEKFKFDETSFGYLFTPATYKYNGKEVHPDFVILHFEVKDADDLGNDEISIQLGNGQTDIFTKADGKDFWTRPIKTNHDGKRTVNVTRSSGSVVQVKVKEYAHGMMEHISAKLSTGEPVPGSGELNNNGVPTRNINYNKDAPGNGRYSNPPTIPANQTADYTIFSPGSDQHSTYRKLSNRVSQIPIDKYALSADKRTDNDPLWHHVSWLDKQNAVQNLFAPLTSSNEDAHKKAVMKYAKSAVGMLIYVANVTDGNCKQKHEPGYLDTMCEDACEYYMLSATATVIQLPDPNMDGTHRDGIYILTAAHAVDTAGDLEIRSGSFILEYESDAQGGKKPLFFKIKQRIKWGFPESATSVDYAILEIEPDPTNWPNDLNALSFVPATVPLTNFITPPFTLADPPTEIFFIHHPLAAPKQISRRMNTQSADWNEDKYKQEAHLSATFPTIIGFDADADNGTSGSALLYLNPSSTVIEPKILGVIFRLTSQYKWAYSYEAIRNHIYAKPKTPRNIIIVLDRSSNMNQKDSNTRSKFENAKEAIYLFLTMLDPSGGHGVGLISFSGQQHIDYPLAPFVGINGTLRNSINRIAAISSNASIGDGLEHARIQLKNRTNLDETIKQNVPYILLLTDGQENSPKYIDEVTGLEDIPIHVIGYGNDSEINGAKLMKLAREHNGIYQHTPSAAQLRKSFALAFGNIFQDTELLFDPIYTIPAGYSSGNPITFDIANESRMRVTLGWERPDAMLALKLTAPNGMTFSPQENFDSEYYHLGDTWQYWDMELPVVQDGLSEQSGTWTVDVERYDAFPLGFFGHKDEVHHIVFSPDGERVITYEQSRLFLWDVKTGRLLDTYTFQEDSVEFITRIAKLEWIPQRNMALITRQNNFGYTIALRDDEEPRERMDVAQVFDLNNVHPEHNHNILSSKVDSQGQQVFIYLEGNVGELILRELVIISTKTWAIERTLTLNSS